MSEEYTKTFNIPSSTNSSNNILGITYAHIVPYGYNLQKNLSLNIYKDALERMDLNVFHNETYLNNSFQFSNFGGNLRWSYYKGHVISFGISHMVLFNTTAMEASVKTNIWKTDTGSCSCDITCNFAHFISGPLEGHHNVMASLTFSYAF